MTDTHPVPGRLRRSGRRCRGVSPPLASAALRAAAAGWAVFPVWPRAKTPAVTDWENRATTDPDRITAWWATAPWNIGLATGPSGLLVLDLDTATDHSTDPVRAEEYAAVRIEAGRDRPVSGLAVLSRLAAAGSMSWWETFTVATPSGGRHLYFRQPDGAGLRNTQGALGPLIDTRGHGGYVLAAGSRGPDVRRYRILCDGPTALLPVWLDRALTAACTPIPAGAEGARVHGEDRRGDDGPGGRPVVSGARVDAYLRAVVDGETRAVAAAQVGTRHTTLLRAARRLGQWVGSGALAHADAHTALRAAARGYLGVAGYTVRQVDRDISDGLGYGAARPRHVDDLPDRPVRRPTDVHG